MSNLTINVRVIVLFLWLNLWIFNAKTMNCLRLKAKLYFNNFPTFSHQSSFSSIIYHAKLSPRLKLYKQNNTTSSCEESLETEGEKHFQLVFFGIFPPLPRKEKASLKTYAWVALDFMNYLQWKREWKVDIVCLYTRIIVKVIYFLAFKNIFIMKSFELWFFLCDLKMKTFSFLLSLSSDGYNNFLQFKLLIKDTFYIFSVMSIFAHFRGSVSLYFAVCTPVLSILQIHSSD